MQSWRQRRRVAAAVMLGGALAGCASQHDDALRLSEELGRARADAAMQQARAAALESRVSQLEQTSALVLRERRSEERELSQRLDRLIVLNEKLLTAQAAPPAPSAASTAPAETPKSNASAAPALSDEEQLRALVEHMHGRPHGRLTREQEAAVRVLTRVQRPLDTEQWWTPAIY